MDNINKGQINSKTFLKRVAVISAFALVLCIPMSNAYAVPPVNVANCVYNDFYNNHECCWTETDPNDPEQIEIYKCQTCWVEKGTVNCTSPYPDQRAPPTTGENIVPEIEGGIEQPPSQNTPPIRSDNSVAPNDGSNVIDEQQANTNSPPTDQRVPPGNVGVLEQLEDSSNNEQSQESEESTDTNNVETTSDSQENDDTSNSETTNSLSKRGNTQSSPVPPECPKQGPIPPDCTMKPKF